MSGGPGCSAPRSAPRAAPGPTAALGSCPVRAGLCISLPCGAPAFPARQRPTPVHRKTPVAGAFGELGHQAAGTADSCLASAPARTPAAAPRAASLPAVHGASHSRALPRLALQARSSDQAPGGGARRPVFPRRRASPPAADVRAVPGPGRFGSVALAERPRPGRRRHRRRCTTVTDPARAPPLGRMDVNELLSVVTNNNNNKLSDCCSVMQTNVP
ncbi:translation initiation factor IF-2-like [Vidua macroura]|uniref:translation initiation factor IF-2-like n=1 Tax=Vidua macroura TaxID=187451 RepID=UPI0023A8A470|nr:translation initiation factor IF-2-like [Vidua macroura]